MVFSINDFYLIIDLIAFNIKRQIINNQPKTCP
jgi:hypothetical protein